MQFAARRFDTGQTVTLKVQGGRIVGIEPAPGRRDTDVWVAPGLVDLQINGFGGQEFNDEGLTTAQIERMCRACDAMGVVRFYATVTTHSRGILTGAVRALARAYRESVEVARRVAGIHLEGPYVSAEDGPRGAHPREYCRAYDWDEFRGLQDAAEGNIRLLTLSPEYPGADEFIARVVESRVVVAIGHTNADSAQIQQAAAAGATLSTHLGNGAHATIRRHPNYIWDQLADDRLTATLIADGHHLPPSVVKCFVRAKSPARCVLISDLVGLAGMPPGVYPSHKAGAIEVLDDGRLVVAGQRQYLFGAGLALAHGVANVMRFAGVNLAAAIAMASSRPAEVLGIQPPRLEPGEVADLILFRLPAGASDPIQIVATLRAGEIVYGQVG